MSGAIPLKIMRRMTSMRRKEIMSLTTGIRRNVATGVVTIVALMGSPIGTAIAQMQQQPVQPTQPAQAQERRVKHALPEDIAKVGTRAMLQEQLQYPHESVPIDATTWDLLHPWYVGTAAYPMLSKNSSSASVQAPWTEIQFPTASFQYQFELNKSILAGTEDKLEARLVVTPLQSSDTTLRLHVSNAEIIGSEEFGSPDLGAVPSSCESTGPVCTFTWHAPTADKQYWGMLKLQATVTVEGTSDEFDVSEIFFSSPMVAGKFTGSFQERMDNGSLVIDAGVDVQRRMVCQVTANLYSADKEIPLQHARLRLLMEPSMKTVSFRFFGKIFRDYGDEGTFRLQDLKAQCANVSYPPEWFMHPSQYQTELAALSKKPIPPREPTHIFFARDDYSYTTRSYPVSAFSNEEFQSPQKTRRLQIYDEIKARKNGQEPTQP